jgi:hypothetical protein
VYENYNCIDFYNNSMVKETKEKEEDDTSDFSFQRESDSDVWETII